MRFKIDWASLIVEGEFTVFALFYFVFESQFSKYKPARGLYLEGRFNGRFLRYPFGKLIFGGAYFQNVTVFQSKGGTIIQGKWLIKGWLLFEEIQ